MLALLDDIMEGRATEETLQILEELAVTVQRGSLCGLGKTAPSPVLSTLRHFRDEYEAHVKHKFCPTGKCKALKIFSVDAALCEGCMRCKKKCPVGAISGGKGEPHRIDPTICVKCGVCLENCKFHAITGDKQ
jgi:NADH-quinone oxidoreductase subunit F